MSIHYKLTIKIHITVSFYCICVVFCQNGMSQREGESYPDLFARKLSANVHKYTKQANQEWRYIMSSAMESNGEVLMRAEKLLDKLDTAPDDLSDVSITCMEHVTLFLTELQNRTEWALRSKYVYTACIILVLILVLQL